MKKMEEICESIKKGNVKEVIPSVIITEYKKNQNGERKTFFYNCNTKNESQDIKDVVNKGEYYSLIKRSMLSYNPIGYSMVLDEENDIITMKYFIATENEIDSNNYSWKPLLDIPTCYITKDKRVLFLDARSNEVVILTSGEIFQHLRTEIDAMGVDVLAEGKNDLSCSVLSFIKYYGEIGKTKGQNYIRIQDIHDIHWILSNIEDSTNHQNLSHNQKIIDDLSAGITGINTMDFNDVIQHDDTYFILDKINKYNNCCVLRVFIPIFQNGPHKIIETQDMVEASRIFFFDKEPIATLRNDINKFIPCEIDDFYQLLIRRSIQFDITKNHHYAKGTLLEYLQPILENIQSKDRGLTLLNLLKYPIAEKLYKSGYKNIASIFLKRKLRYPGEILEGIYNKDNDYKKDNIYSILGMNKHQLGVFDKNILVEKSIYDTDYVVKTIKYIMKNPDKENNMDISHMDNDTFDKLYYILLNYIKDIEVLSRGEYKIKELKDIEPKKHADDDTDFASILQRLYSMYGLKAVWAMHEKVKDMCFGKHLMHNGVQTYLPSKYYEDYLKMASSLLEEYKMPYKFESYEDIQNAHDSLLIVYHEKNTKIENKKYEKRIEEIKKYEYENDTCIVVSPKDTMEIVVEGTELRHCVKTYIEDVCDGKTNILFIRNKQEPNKPFFTVEVSNDGEIKQIHGFGNRNIDTEPMVSDFVDEWLKTEKVKMYSYC